MTKKTLLILGAGASMPYGYPSGDQLRKYLSYDLPDTFLDGIDGYRGGPDGRHEVQMFKSVFRDSKTDTIDDFLSANPSFASIGKQGIVYALHQSEMKSHDGDGKKDIGAEDWYRYLWNQIKPDPQSETLVQDLQRIALNVITFNYDRSFEHFVHRAVTNTFRDRADSDQTFLSSVEKSTFLSPHHVYGCYARLPWNKVVGDVHMGYGDNGKPSRAFGENNVKLMGDIANDQSTINLLVNEADRIFFLGFGFGVSNVRLLHLIANIRRSQHVYATAFEMKGRAKDRVRDLLRNGDGETPAHFIEDCTASELLREYF